MKTKVCRRCFKEKQVSEMKRDPRYGDGYSSFCKACHQESSVAWQKENKERVNAVRKIRYSRIKDSLNKKRKESYDHDSARWKALEYRYKIDKSWYEKTLSEQSNCCAICGDHFSKFKRHLAVDHDHSCCKSHPTCGKCNRGILCHQCNTAIHSLEKRENWIQSAYKYLEHYK